MPTLDPLPPPLANRQGWPWTAAAPLWEEETPVDIVMPSFNQAPYLESAIRSVLLQGLPGLRLHVLDGGSTDGSVAILERYAPWLASWRSRPDEGQAAAINEGLRLGNAPVCAWLNSDDLLEPGGVARILRLRRENPEARVWVGACRILDAADAQIKIREPQLGNLEEMARWFVDAGFQQPGAFFAREVFETLGGVDAKLQCFLDVDFWLRAKKRGFAFAATTGIVGQARVYPDAKSFRLARRQLVEWIATTWNLDLPDVAEWRVGRYTERLQKQAALEGLARWRAAGEGDVPLSAFTARELIRHLGRRMVRRWRNPT